MRILGCLAMVAACGGGGGGGGGGDDAPPGDGGKRDAAVDITELSGDFSCAGTAWPATAPDPLSVQGRVVDPVAMENVGGGAVEIHKISDDSVVVMGTAASNGIFAFNVSTGGAAIDVYRKATAANHLDGYTYDPYAPFDGNHAGRNIYAPTAASRDTYYTAGGVTADAAKATVLVEVLDCTELPVYGATLEVPGAAKVIYLDDGGLPSGSTTATGSTGIAVALDVAPGTADITVHAGSVVYRARTLGVRANAFVYSPRLP